jgi:hypothetical protein
MTRTQILDRYRHLRTISKHHHNTALKLVSRPTLLEIAKRLGLTQGRTLTAYKVEEMIFAFDLALYTAKEGRSCALDRYARTASSALGSDEAPVLEAMRHALFSIWLVERKHETAGLILTDTIRMREQWLVDEQLEASVPDGMVFAARLFEPDSFAMSCGVIVPLSAVVVETVMRAALAWQCPTPGQLAQDRRFATAIYRVAIDRDIMASVAYAGD